MKCPQCVDPLPPAYYCSQGRLIQEEIHTRIMTRIWKSHLLALFRIVSSSHAHSSTHFHTHPKQKKKRIRSLRVSSWTRNSQHFVPCFYLFIFFCLFLWVSLPSCSPYQPFWFNPSIRYDSMPLFQQRRAENCFDLTDLKDYCWSPPFQIVSRVRGLTTSRLTATPLPSLTSTRALWGLISSRGRGLSLKPWWSRTTGSRATPSPRPWRGEEVRTL